MRVPVRLLRVPEHEAAEDDDADADQHQAIARIGRAEDVDGAADRLVQALVAEAEDRLGALAQQQAQAPGHDQRVERPLVERPHQPALDRVAEHAADDERERHRREVRPAVLLRDVGAVGADHHQLAVREVEDAEQAEHDRQAERQDRQRGDPEQRVQRLGDEDRPSTSDGGRRLSGAARRMTTRRAASLRPCRRCRS